MNTIYTNQLTKDLLLIVKLAAKAHFLIRHDQVEAAGSYVQGAHDSLKELREHASDSPECNVAARTYELVRKEYQEALR